MTRREHLQWAKDRALAYIPESVPVHESQALNETAPSPQEKAQ